MVMSVDNHIEVLKSYHHGFTGYAGNLQDSIDVAVNIMCKYQKIQTIVKAWNDMNSFDSMVQISEVIEDETNRC